MTRAADGWSVSRHWPAICVGKLRVLVPAAVEELDEAHAALGQPAGQQAVGGERARACRTRGRTGRRRARGSSERSVSSGTEVCMR